MKKQKTQSKIIVALSAVIVLLVALSATLTFAYFTASKANSDATMTFGTLAMGGVDLSLATSDTHATGGVAAGINNLEPGCTVALTGTVTVTSSIKAFARIGLTVTYLGADKATGGTGDNADVSVTSYAVVADANVKANIAQVVFNKLWTILGTTAPSGTAWIAGADGKLYLNKAVGGSGEAEALVTLSGNTINFGANEIGNAWQDAKIVVSLNADAIQAEHLTDVNADDTITADGTGEGNVAVATVAGLGMWADPDGIVTA